MTNQAAMELGKNCPNLVYVDLNRCFVNEIFGIFLMKNVV